MNILPNEVLHSVRNCEVTKQHEHVNSLLGYRGTQADLNDINFLSFLKPPPTDGFKDYNTKQIEMCAALLHDSHTSPPPPLFPPPAPSPSPCPFNFSYDDDSTEATPDVIPVPTLDLQVQQQPSQH